MSKSQAIAELVRNCVFMVGFFFGLSRLHSLAWDVRDIKHLLAGRSTPDTQQEGK